MSLGAAVRPLQCANPDCTLPVEGRCALAAQFEDPLGDCPNLKREAVIPPPVPQTTVSAKSNESGAPWSGRHLDGSQAEALVFRSPARVIAVLGPYNAGKTCFITSFFLQVASGQRESFPYRFASSRTLYGFQELVQRANRWTGNAEADIVEHTPREESRRGNFLHLGVRPASPTDDRHIDILLSDLPGEWITDWAQLEGEDSRRRLAFISRCDGFIAVADAEALLSPSGPKLDATMAGLIRRAAGGERRVGPARSLALVFSKFDRVIDQLIPPPREARLQRTNWGRLGARSPRIWAALDDAKRAGLSVDIFPVSAFPAALGSGQPVGVMAPVSFVMNAADGRERWAMSEAPIARDCSSFLALRRGSVAR